jgi:hypothetical protein
MRTHIINIIKAIEYVIRKTRALHGGHEDRDPGNPNGILKR